MRMASLVYHRVGPADPDPRSAWLTVTPEAFERQVRWLKWRGYTGINGRDWLAWVRDRKPLPKQPVMFTFDDAYEEVAQHALPVLERAGFSAVVFVVTGQLGGTNAWDEGKGLPMRRLMSAEQIKDWAARGIEFGGHGHQHLDLTKLDAAALEAELAACVRGLDELVGEPAVSFAYPYGARNAEARAAVGRHFDLSVSTEEGLNDEGSDLLDLERTYVLPGDMFVDLESRARLGFSVVRRIQGAVRLRTRLRALWP